MYDYTVCTVPDRDVFYKQCEALERKMPNLTKEKIMRDVDDSLIQIYVLDGKLIKVSDDHYLRRVHIESEIDLDKVF